jgi:3-methyladenine DNA glycosylase AlkD
MPPLDELSDRLRALADPAKKAWWERYLKGEAEFIGVPMAGIRGAVHRWVDEANLDDEATKDAAFALLRRPFAEEKLAGILLLQERAAPAGVLDADTDLPALAALFDDGHIREWNTTDWLCVRVLGPMIERGGPPVAEAVAGWVDAPGLWRRRAAAVAFVPLAGRGDAVFAGLVATVLGVCAANVADPARFAQTGVGWVLRDLSDAAPDAVYAFLIARRSEMSREAARMAAARLSDDQRSSLGITGKCTRR